jgi:hypothetical protein
VRPGDRATVGGAEGNAHRLGHLFLSQAGEVTELDDLDRLGRFPLQFFQRLADLHQPVLGQGRTNLNFVEGGSFQFTDEPLVVYSRAEYPE